MCYFVMAYSHRFSTRLYPTTRPETFLEACGMADLVATCYGGRNRLVSMEFAKAWKVKSDTLWTSVSVVAILVPSRPAPCSVRESLP